MATMKRAAQVVVFLLCVGFVVAAIVNVFGDHTEVEKLAKETACEAAQPKPAAPPAGKPAAAAAAPGLCAMTMTKMSRTPFGQSYEYTGSNSMRRIQCTRSLILVGEYACLNE